VVRIETPDLLHVHSPVLNALSALSLKKLIRLPIVYEVRAFWEDAFVDRGVYTENSWKYKVTRALEMWACRTAEQVVVVCQGLRNKLIEQGVRAEKLDIVSNGVNLDDLQSQLPDSEYAETWGLEGKRVIGFIGSFFRYEGLDLLIEAVARMTKTRNDIALLLVGDGEMSDRLKEQINRLCMKEVVRLPGMIPHTRIPGVYALMDVVVYPRYSARLTELVTPLKPLEAMALGKPVVASDVGGHRELIQDGKTGLLFPAGNVAALADAVGRLVDNPVLRQEYGTQASAWIRATRSWDRTTAAYSEIYARALAR
jgi:PEP-CTERM/exosortase A-associated glycosyltransferase